MSVRLAHAGDVPLLPEIEVSSGRLFEDVVLESALDPDESISVEALQTSLESNSLWVAVDAQDHSIGFVAATVHGDECFVAQISVAHEAQGRGLGSELMRTVIEDARRRGARAVTLTTFRDIPWNAPFYAKLGFQLLTPDELSPHLIATLANEAARGLLPIERCAMRLTF